MAKLSKRLNHFINPKSIVTINLNNNNNNNDKDNNDLNCCNYCNSPKQERRMIPMIMIMIRAINNPVNRILRQNRNQKVV